MNLTKWFPFKFSRKSAEEKTGEKKPAGPAEPSESAIAPWGAYRSALEPFRMLEQLMRDPFGAFGTVDRWFGDYSPASFHPRVDVVDDGKAIRITAELPGMAREDVSVTIDEGSVVLKGEKRVESSHEEGGCYRVERAFGTFHRVIPLPTDVNRDSAEATFSDGVLTVRVPKSNGKTPTGRSIAIN